MIPLLRDHRPTGYPSSEQALPDILGVANLKMGRYAIFTGAAMPLGADTVILQENARREEDWVEFTHRPEPDRHVRPIGNDVHEGVQILTRGTRLRAFEIGWISACGLGAGTSLSTPQDRYFRNRR